MFLQEKNQYLKNGAVKVNNKVVRKPSKEIKETDKVEVLKSFNYVGRGAYKLEKAVKQFKINFKIIVNI